MSIRPVAKIARIVLLIIWVVLLVALLKRDYFIKTLDLREARVIQQGREESFLGVYFQGQRIGYVKNRLHPAGPDTLILSQEALLRLNILDQIHPVRMTVTAELANDLLLRSFTFHLDSPFYRMDARGTVRGREVRFELTSGKETIKEVIRLAEPPFLSTSQRGYLLTRDLKPGDRRRVPYFDPMTLSGQNSVIEYQGREKVLINGRVHNLHRFTESFSGLFFNSWLNDAGKLIKEESPAGFVFLAEPEFKATDLVHKGKELLSSVSVPLTGTMPELDQRTSLSFRLTMPADNDFDLNQDRQRVTNDIVTVTLEDLPAEDAEVCADADAELAATPYIQSKNAALNKLVRETTAAAATPLAKVRALASWVFTNLEKRPVLGIPDALTTFHTRRGDCNEHAALFAALARGAGIPCRVVAGVVFHQGAFYYHAWNEVCLDNRWISLDTTRDQLPADITHIKFIQGETREMIRIGALLGRLSIEVVDQPLLSTGAARPAGP
ncbi:MAG: transglutaminase-like domain-containing protein [Desulfobacterales bacterium]|nr:transglutaminase-like domain-containing protein [Desulfobacterales bacterium]